MILQEYAHKFTKNSKKMALKLKIKKTLLKRKVNGEVTEGYYGRVITNGKKTYEEIAEEACRNTTVHRAEMKVASELLLDAVSAQLKAGMIVDLGPLGTLYPAVTGKWDADPDGLSLDDMKPRVTYKPSQDIASAIRAARLQWTSEAETEDNTVPDDDQNPDGPGTQNPPVGELEG